MFLIRHPASDAVRKEPELMLCRGYIGCIPILCLLMNYPLACAPIYKTISTFQNFDIAWYKSSAYIRGKTEVLEDKIRSRIERSKISEDYKSSWAIFQVSNPKQ